ncbi:MAG TPA: hypothetical protein VHY08_12365, partial [Bacillota bacterium]|nr:hypothetical protein [Bacillota bacterium]
LSTVNYNPPRGPSAEWGDSSGDEGNRVDRFLACVAYLDGVRPSLVMCRGYYAHPVPLNGGGPKIGQTWLAAWDFRGGSLTPRWTFGAIRDQSGTGNANWQYTCQGNHNLSVGDVDSDGKDEIIYGAMAINDDGSKMYYSGSEDAHGDAMHLGDLDPDRPGLEVWQCHEAGLGADLRDARTGQVIFRYASSGDVGRACAADLTSTKGVEVWAGSSFYTCKGANAGTVPSSCNFVIWWDGDDYRELLNGTTISKYGGSTLLSASGCAANNGTKSNPCLSADILGDWREEVIFRTSDSSALRIYTTTNTTSRRVFTLMHDIMYRLAIAWQNVAYNQPPHTSFYLGGGMSTPAMPNIYLAP